MYTLVLLPSLQILFATTIIADLHEKMVNFMVYYHLIGTEIIFIKRMSALYLFSILRKKIQSKIYPITSIA
jgi:hypothetical protein